MLLNINDYGMVVPIGDNRTVRCDDDDCDCGTIVLAVESCYSYIYFLLNIYSYII